MTPNQEQERADLKIPGDPPPHPPPPQKKKKKKKKRKTKLVECTSQNQHKIKI